jgi:hypothetical protein
MISPDNSIHLKEVTDICSDLVVAFCIREIDSHHIMSTFLHAMDKITTDGTGTPGR